MLLAGVTGLPAEVRKIADCAGRCGLSTVQLNTVVRPPAEDFACPLENAQLQEFAGYFEGQVEIICEREPDKGKGAPAGVVKDSEILGLLGRRPCTVRGIAAGLALLPNEVLKRLQPLASQGKVRSVRKDNTLFYETVRDRES